MCVFETNKQTAILTFTLLVRPKLTRTNLLWPYWPARSSYCSTLQFNKTISIECCSQIALIWSVFWSKFKGVFFLFFIIFFSLCYVFFLCSLPYFGIRKTAYLTFVQHNEMKNHVTKTLKKEVEKEERICCLKQM